MPDALSEQIKRVKSCVQAMKEERGAFTGEEQIRHSPSEFWLQYCSYIDYVAALPEEFLSDIRFHTHPFTGDRWNSYFEAPLIKTEARTALWRQYNNCASQLPAEFHIDEPEPGIGFKYENGHFLSLDILLYQRAVAALWFGGVFEKKDQGRSYVFEIGPGYGGLIHHVSRLIGESTCVIVDLPEMLLFTGIYLSIHNPTKRIYVYSPDDFDEFNDSNGFHEYDFVLMPDYRLDSFKQLRFDAVINMNSLPEMRIDQAETYLDFIAETRTGTFYSRNLDVFKSSYEDRVLTDLLEERFHLSRVAVDNSRQLHPRVRSAAKNLAITLGLKLRPAPTHNEYLAVSLTAQANKPLMPSKSVADKPFHG